MNTAKRNMEMGDYRAANNRAYYAIFHAIDACLALEDKAFKRHGQAVGAFKEILINQYFLNSFTIHLLFQDNSSNENALSYVL